MSHAQAQAHRSGGTPKCWLFLFATDRHTINGNQLVHVHTQNRCLCVWCNLFATSLARYTPNTFTSVTPSRQHCARGGSAGVREAQKRNSHAIQRSYFEHSLLSQQHRSMCACVVAVTTSCREVNKCFFAIDWESDAQKSVMFRFGLHLLIEWSCDSDMDMEHGRQSSFLLFHISSAWCRPSSNRCMRNIFLMISTPLWSKTSYDARCDAEKNAKK